MSLSSAVARHTDPITSHEAAETVAVSDHERIVLHLLAERDMTDAEMVDLHTAHRRHGCPTCGPASAASLRSRRGEIARRPDSPLVHVGYRVPDHGRRAQVWSYDPARAVEEVTPHTPRPQHDDGPTVGALFAGY